MDESRPSADDKSGSHAVSDPQLSEMKDSVVRDDETREIASVFTTNYTPTKSIGQSLPALPEEISVEHFNNPSIEISPESPIASADAIPNSFPSLSPDVAVSPVVVSGLSPMISKGHQHQRRRSSTSGHRRRSSTRSLTGLGITTAPTLQHRSSITSNTSIGEFEEFQDGDGDGGSDFGDFDDFEEGAFTDDEDEPDHTGQAVPLAQHANRILLPDPEDEDDLRQHTLRLISQLVQNDNTKPISSAAADSEAQRTASEEAPVESDEDDDSPFMLTDRAVSLWKQLTAPPPLQPPDWKRSRIRRLFLVSLGIPVDLDEILPKMTHKKLILPSTKRHRDRKSAEMRRSRKKIPPPPEFEIATARQICTTTREALTAMTIRERDIHVATLKAHTTAASNLLTYWLEQRDAAQSEKDTFEQVVSNLVQYHKKQKDDQKETATKISKKTRSRFSMRS